MKMGTKTHGRLLAAVIWLIASLLCLSATGRAADVEFRWAILAERSKGMEALDFKGSPVVHSGTALQIYLEHLENCHIYLFLLDSSGLLTPLYPGQSDYYNYGFPRGPKLIPPGDESFAFVPPPGDEIFYLIASARRLFHLEELTDIFRKNPRSPGQHDLLLQELETLIGDVEKKSEAAEDIERIDFKVKTEAGIKERTIRAVEVKIGEMYGRKLVVDHR